MSSDIKPCRNAVGVAPTALLSLGMGFKYERAVQGKISAYLEGTGFAGSAFSPTRGWQGGLGIRRYFREALRGKYLGAFFRFADLQSEIDADIERVHYHYDLDGKGLWAVGLHCGSRRIWKNGVTLDWRIGYGFGKTDFKWNPAPSKDFELSKSIMDATSGFDSELTLGLAF